MFNNFEFYETKKLFKTFSDKPYSKKKSRYLLFVICFEHLKKIFGASRGPG